MLPTTFYLVQMPNTQHGFCSLLMEFIFQKLYVYTILRPNFPKKKLKTLSTYVISYINKGNSLFFLSMKTILQREQSVHPLPSSMSIRLHVRQTFIFHGKEDSVQELQYLLDRTFPHKRIQLWNRTCSKDINVISLVFQCYIPKQASS